MFFKKKLLILVMAMLSISACKDSSEADKKKIPEVEAVNIVPSSVPLSFEYPGRAKGFRETEVRARVGGILLSRNYIEGSTVKEGDILFQIDPEPYKASLRQAEGQLAEFQARLKAAKTQWNRIEKLFKDRIVSEKSRDDARASMDSLKASVDAAEGELQTAQLNLNYTTVTAPISGITSLESQSEGSLIVANSDASLLTTITQVDPIYIMFSISDSDMFRFNSMVSGNVFEGNPHKRGVVTAKLKFSDGSTYDKTGEINFINPTVDEATGTVMMRAIFANPNRKIMPQQFLRIEVEGLEMQNAITIPKEAVMQGAQGSFVYKINDKSETEVAIIETGFTAKNGEWVVEKGLQAGDIVITNGIMKLKESMQVKPVFKQPESK